GAGACSCFFFSSRRRHTRFSRDWSSDVCSSDLTEETLLAVPGNPLDLDFVGHARRATALRTPSQARPAREKVAPAPGLGYGRARSEERRVGRGRGAPWWEVGEEDDTDRGRVSVV